MFRTIALIIMPITDLPLEVKYCSACIGAPRAPIYSGAEVVGREARQRDAATAGGVARHSLEGGVIGEGEQLRPIGSAGEKNQGTIPVHDFNSHI